MILNELVANMMQKIVHNSLDKDIFSLRLIKYGPLF